MKHNGIIFLLISSYTFFILSLKEHGDTGLEMYKESHISVYKERIRKRGRMGTRRMEKGASCLSSRYPEVSDMTCTRE